MLYTLIKHGFLTNQSARALSTHKVDYTVRLSPKGVSLIVR